MSIYLKGQLGAWLPRQPQWQHWGELWFTGACVVDAAVEEARTVGTVQVVECMFGY